MPVIGNLRHEAITVSGTAIGMTVTVGRGFIPNAAEITVENASVRWRSDGTDPTPTTGNLATPGGDPIKLLDRGEVTLFRAIKQGGSDATLRVEQGIDYVP